LKIKSAKQKKLKLRGKRNFKPKSNKELKKKFIGKKKSKKSKSNSNKKLRWKN